VGVIQDRHSNKVPRREEANLGIEITRIEAIPVTIPYVIPWRNKHTELAGEALTHLHTNVLKVHTNEGIVGLGEARGDDVVSAVTGRVQRFLEGRNPLDIEGVLNGMEEELGWSRLCAGIDFALHDIAGKFHDVPVYALLGGKAREAVPLVWTLPYVDTNTQIAQATERVAEGFTHAVKMKVGVAGDQDHVLAVAEAIPNVLLRPDNNQGHDADTAIAQFKGLLDAGVKLEMVEDPSPSNWDDYQRISDALGVGVSVHAGWKSLKDIGSLIRANKPGIVCVNVTFSNWGIRKSIQIAGALECAGIKWSMGTSHESGIKTAAALHTGCVARNEMAPADVLGPRLFEGDVLTEALDIKAGYGRPFDKPGLGITLSEEALELYAPDRAPAAPSSHSAR
jgi:L-alanine-DL-glutamate epimerase-like enolase superfamily enzyme